MSCFVRIAFASLLAVVGTLLPALTAQSLAENHLYIGHSFFRPFAENMPFHTAQAGITDHTQTVVFNGGANGAPQALWENAAKRAEIQAALDLGNVDLFAMTYHPDYPTSEGYENWINYALAQNAATRFVLALPWGTDPGTTDAAGYSSFWHAGHDTAWHDLIDYLRSLYPGVEITCLPYGQSATDLRLLFEDNNLPGINNLVGAAGDSLYVDAFGHAGDIIKDLGSLVWLRKIYEVDMSTYSYAPPWATDLKSIAQVIMDDHDAAFGPPAGTPGCGDTPRTGCRTAAKSLLQYRDDADDSRDRLSFKWTRGEATSQAEFGDPTTTTQFDLCIYAGSAADLYAEANVTAGGSNWAPVSTKGFKYRDAFESQGGTGQIVLKGHASAPQSKILWKGAGTNLPDLPISLPVPAPGFPLLVQISGSDTSACFETSFEAADVVSNDDRGLKLKQK